MFSTKEFIDASRAFVCVRIETYENKESEKMVRSLLNGAFANTAFCVFDPQGKRKLSRSGRSPSQLVGRRSSGGNPEVIKEMAWIASKYQANASGADAELQDFLSFKQALNVASADQRLLVFVNADNAAVKKLTPTLKSLFADKDVIGRFHLDIAGEEDAEWDKVIDGADSKPAINVVRAGKFGMDGAVVSRLALDTSLEDLKKELLSDNKKFSKAEDRKDYADHVREGRRKGIKFESEIPWGEDRDGDGKVDDRGRGGGENKGGRGRRQ